MRAVFQDKSGYTHAGFTSIENLLNAKLNIFAKLPTCLLQCYRIMYIGCSCNSFLFPWIIKIKLLVLMYRVLFMLAGTC